MAAASQVSVIAKLESFASHFECGVHDPLGLGVKFRIVHKLSYGHTQALPMRTRTHDAVPCVSKE